MILNRQPDVQARPRPARAGTVASYLRHIAAGRGRTLANVLGPSCCMGEPGLGRGPVARAPEGTYRLSLHFPGALQYAACAE